MGVALDRHRLLVEWQASSARWCTEQPSQPAQTTPDTAGELLLSLSFDEDIVMDSSPQQIPVNAFGDPQGIKGVAGSAAVDIGIGAGYSLQVPLGSVWTAVLWLGTPVSTEGWASVMAGGDVQHIAISPNWHQLFKRQLLGVFDGVQFFSSRFSVGWLSAGW